jgi:predicted PurR-regulated permease PerM
MSGIFENSGMRRLFAAFAAVAAAFLLFVALFCNIFINRMETSIAEREYSAAGRLVNTGKLNEDDVITAFTAGNDANSIESGENVLKSAGYNTDTADFLMPFLQSNLNMFSFSMMIAAVLLVLILVLYCFFAFRNIYEKIDGLAKHAGRIGRRIYNIKLDDNFEGAVARVYHAFNEMQSTIKADFEKLEHDRVFLKNLIGYISSIKNSAVVTENV